MVQEELVSKIVEAVGVISKNERKPEANYIQLSQEFIMQQAYERGVSFYEMVEIFGKELLPSC